MQSVPKDSLIQPGPAKAGYFFRDRLHFVGAFVHLPRCLTHSRCRKVDGLDLTTLRRAFGNAYDGIAGSTPDWRTLVCLLVDEAIGETWKEYT